MAEKKIRCMRCRGLKQIYKVGSGYSFADMGGLRVECPMCKGEGVIESLEQFKNVVKQEEKIEGCTGIIAEDPDQKPLSAAAQEGLHLAGQVLAGQAAAKAIAEAGSKKKGKKK